MTLQFLHKLRTIILVDCLYATKVDALENMSSIILLLTIQAAISPKQV